VYTSCRKRAVEVDLTYPGFASGSVRKNLAVHVSLSSIFTMSKSWPRVPGSGSTSVEAVLPNFCGQEVHSGFPAAPLPFQISAPQPPRSGAAPVKSDGGVYCRVFLLSTPLDDKIDIFGNAGFAAQVRPRLRLHSTRRDRESRICGAIQKPGEKTWTNSALSMALAPPAARTKSTRQGYRWCPVGL